jgi:hypothetical protein
LLPVLLDIFAVHVQNFCNSRSDTFKTNVVMTSEPAPIQQTLQPLPSIQDRWAGMEQWIQNHPSKEFRKAYNNAEVGEARAISDEEWEELKIRHHYKP